MIKARKLMTAVVSLVLALGLTACGTAGTRSTLVAPQSVAQVADTSAQDFTPDEARTASDLNKSGVLDTKDISDYETVLGRSATKLNTANTEMSVAGGVGSFSVSHLTKIGYVRSVEDGKYLLVIGHDQTKLSVTGQDGKRDSRIAGYLNHKVLLRGIMLPSGQLMVEHIICIPSFRFITDFFFKARLDGTVLLSNNNQGLVGALVVAKQGSTGYLFRTQTDRKGNYGFSGLDPDTYTVTVGLGGFKGTTQEGVLLIKGKKTTVNVSMTPGS